MYNAGVHGCILENTVISLILINIPYMVCQNTKIFAKVLINVIIIIFGKRLKMKAPEVTQLFYVVMKHTRDNI